MKTADSKKSVVRKTGAQLMVHALERLPVRHTFGIPGVHVTELYDELGKSEKIRPILVTHEGGGAFMADAFSRTGDPDTIGVLLIVPAAGMTHAMSGIGEAFLDGIPMLIISGGVRRDTNRAYQLHDMDMHKIMSNITKKTFLIRSHQEIVPTVFDAYNTAVSGEPGPVFIELPADIQMFRGSVENLSLYTPKRSAPQMPDTEAVKAGASLLRKAKRPGIYSGWGSRMATEEMIRIAEILEAPVATTLQGLSVFPASHRLHTGMGFSIAAVPAAYNAFAECDCLLAVGVRFAEIPTGSYGVKVPENLIHIDINPSVFDKNYPAKVAIHADARAAAAALLREIEGHVTKNESPAANIARDKKAYVEEWLGHRNDRVNPALFFESLRRHMDEDALMVVDDGNHTFLAAELFPVHHSRHFISPTDFNAMGYCVPAAIGAKLADPEKQVVGIAGDGSFIMTCMEILTASTENLGIVYFVFHDGELGQISQGQEIPYNRKICTILGRIGIEGTALATGAKYFEIKDNSSVETIVPQALSSAKKGPVIVDVKIDYSKRTRFTKGVVKTVSGRFPLGETVRFVGRALVRKAVG